MHVASFCRRVARAGLVALTLAAAGTPAQTPRGANARDLESPSEGRAVELTVNLAIKSEKTSEWILLPIPKASPAIGGGLQLIGARFFQVDANSQPSVLAACRT